MKRISPRRVVFLCLLLSAACLCACATQSSSPADVPGSAVRARLGDFALRADGAGQEGTDLVRVVLLHKDRDLSRVDDPLRAVTANQVQQNFPLPECRSMAVELFTGGANCCFGYYLLTACPDAEYAAFIEPRDGGIGKGDPALRAYPADDSAFFYYEPAGQSGNDKLSFSRVTSPRLTRYIVFDNGVWRADKPGELPAVYKTQSARAARDANMDRSAKAIVMSYYSLMAGNPPAVAERVLKRNLPRQYAKLAPAVFADVQKAVDGFGPVKNIEVGVE